MSEIKISDTADMSKKEPLLIEEPDERLSVYPIKYQDIWDMYKGHEAAIWHASEVKLQGDLDDWAQLTADEKTFVKNVLAFFATSDIIVAKNLAQRFLLEIPILEVKIFYTFQMMMENIHSETYGNMIETYITDPAEKQYLRNAVVNIPSVGKKAAWANKWITSSDSFAERLIAFAAVEGIFFSGAFSCIYWLTEKGKMPGLAKGNDFIARDEGRHTEFACLLYRKYIVNKLTQARVEEIIREAVDMEIEFITESLPCRLIGMNSTLMIEYIKYVANHLVMRLSHQEIYPGVRQPLTCMDRISLASKSNFFENDPTEYSKNSRSNIASNDDFYKDL